MEFSAPTRGLISVGIELYTLINRLENSWIDSKPPFLILLYLEITCKGIFLSSHLSKNEVLKASDVEMDLAGKSLNHFFVSLEKT